MTRILDWIIPPSALRWGRLTTATFRRVAIIRHEPDGLLADLLEDLGCDVHFHDLPCRRVLLAEAGTEIEPGVEIRVLEYDL